MRTIERRLHFGQSRVLFDKEHRHHVLPAGIRYGKSYLGPPWHHNRVRANPRSHISLVTAPNYRLLKLVNLALYLRYLSSIGLQKGRHYRVNRSSDALSIIFPATKQRVEHTVLFLSTDNPDAIVGFTASHAWGDECALSSEDAYRNVVQRVSDPDAMHLRQMLWTSVPQGTGSWFYEKFGDAKTTRVQGTPYSESKSTLVLHGSMFDNPYLDDAYREQLVDEFSWDENYYRNFVLGEWVNLSTNAFYFKFSDKKNIKACSLLPDTNQFYLTFDFNVDFMSWSALQKQHVSAYKKPVYAVFKSNRSNGRNIQEACQQFIDAFPPSKFKNYRITVLGDPAGYARSTHTHDTGYDLIESFLQPHYPFLRVEAGRGSPEVYERKVCTNRLFAEGRLIIDPSCTKVIESARMAVSNGERGIKKGKDDKVTHAMEAVDMALMQLEPPESFAKRASGFNRF
jgi:hypothetical protein